MSGSNGSVAKLTTDELRAAVRAVLREVLPADGANAQAETTEIELRTDGDVDALVRRVAVLCEDPAQRMALRQGRRRFRLAAPNSEPDATGSVVRVESGAVTERAVAKAAAEGARLVIGRRAVLTPLARDKARSLGVQIDKER